jgi:predicted Rossmann fold nucleotide-binding protein DprA/Smf involved in DNA uptake
MAHVHNSPPLHQYLAIFCSRRCPGVLILRAYDLAVALREAGVPVVGGFHTPIEREMLAVLLRGSGPVAIVEARGERKQFPKEWQQPLRDGRLQVESPFPGVRRQTAATAARRNRIVVERAAAVLVVHAAPGGQTEALVREVAACGTPLLTLDDAANANLLALGALPVSPPPASWPDALRRLVSDLS